MDHQGCSEITRVDLAPQVVLVPASALAIFVRIAAIEGALGAWWALDTPGVTVADVEHPGRVSFDQASCAGPFFHVREIPPGYVRVFTTRGWGDMVHAARSLPLHAVVASADAVRNGERWIYLPLVLVRGLTAPASDRMWAQLDAVSEYAAPLEAAVHALLESELIAGETARGEVAP